MPNPTRAEFCPLLLFSYVSLLNFAVEGTFLSAKDDVNDASSNPQATEGSRRSLLNLRNYRYRSPTGDHQISTLQADPKDLKWMYNTRNKKKKKGFLPFDQCRGELVTWQVKTAERCRTDFGKDSIWNSDEAKCRIAYRYCLPWYGKCCTQPHGAETLSVYCDVQKIKEAEEKNGEEDGSGTILVQRKDAKPTQPDTACEADAKVRTIKELMKNITKAADAIAFPVVGDDEEPVATTTTEEPGISNLDDGEQIELQGGEEEAEASLDFEPEAKLEANATKEDEEQGAVPAPAEVSLSAPSPAQISPPSGLSPWPSPAQAPGPSAGPAAVLEDDEEEEEDAEAKPEKEEPAPSKSSEKSEKEAEEEKPVEITCDDLNMMVVKAKKEIRDLETWAADRFDSPKEKIEDPELAEKTKSLVKVGDKLEKQTGCKKFTLKDDLDGVWKGDDGSTGEVLGMTWAHFEGKQSAAALVQSQRRFRIHRQPEPEPKMYAIRSLTDTSFRLSDGFGGGSATYTIGKFTVGKITMANGVIYTREVQHPEVWTKALKRNGRQVDEPPELKKKGSRHLQVGVNRTGLADLEKWVIEMNDAMYHFDHEVHPHGVKWWRYRWEYSMVESMIVVPLWFLIPALIRGFKKLGILANARVNKLFTLDPFSMNQYAFLFFVFQAGAVALVALLIWVLHETTYFFDGWARLVRWIDGFAGREDHVPFLGQSYYEHVMDVLFHLLSTFSLYTLCLLVFIRKSVYRIRMWIELAEWERQNIEPRGSIVKDAQFRFNKENLADFKEHFYRYVSTLDEYRLPFMDAGFSLEPNGRPDNFQFQYYLSESFGRAASYLATIEIWNALALAMFSLLVGLIAYFFHIEFRYLMEPIFVFTILLCGGTGLLFQYIKKRIHNEKSGQLGKVSKESVMGPKRWAKITQFLLIMLFYSFSRLLLSRDIWLNYFWQAVWALLMMVAFFLLLHFVLVDLMHITICWFSIPPNVAPTRFASYIQAVREDLQNHVRMNRGPGNGSSFNNPHPRSPVSPIIDCSLRPPAPSPYTPGAAGYTPGAAETKSSPVLRAPSRTPV